MVRGMGGGVQRASCLFVPLLTTDASFGRHLLAAAVDAFSSPCSSYSYSSSFFLLLLLLLTLNYDCISHFFLMMPNARRSRTGGNNNRPFCVTATFARFIQKEKKKKKKTLKIKQQRPPLAFMSAV